MGRRRTYPVRTTTAMQGKLSSRHLRGLLGFVGEIFQISSADQQCPELTRNDIVAVGKLVSLRSARILRVPIRQSALNDNLITHREEQRVIASMSGSTEDTARVDWVPFWLRSVLDVAALCCVACLLMTTVIMTSLFGGVLLLLHLRRRARSVQIATSIVEAGPDRFRAKNEKHVGPHQEVVGWRTQTRPAASGDTIE